MEDRAQILKILHDAWQADPASKDKARAYAGFLRDAGRDAEARDIYLQALRHHDHDRDLLFALARVAYALRDDTEAQRLFERLVAAYPHDADILINAGKMYKSAGLYAPAEDCYRRALSSGDKDRLPLAAFHYAHLLLAQARWQSGFTAYEARLSLSGAMPVPFGLPFFRADMPKGSTILLWSDQGLGDALMFARFIPMLRDRGYDISLLVQQPLLRLMQGIEGVAQIRGPLDPAPDCAAALALGSLPFALQAEPFWNGAYIKPPMDRWLPPRQKKRRVGLAWAGNPAHRNNKSRSMDFAALAPLLALPDVEFFSLQKENNPILPPENLQIPAPHLTDLAATASVIVELDLVISVDTSVAHLAGAMGKECWLMLPRRDVDWRWGLAGESSLWYPSMHLFRQAVAGDWASVIAAVAARLETR